MALPGWGLRATTMITYTLIVRTPQVYDETHGRRGPDDHRGTGRQGGHGHHHGAHVPVERPAAPSAAPRPHRLLRPGAPRAAQADRPAAGTGLLAGKHQAAHRRVGERPWPGRHPGAGD